jgi:hypothetical protein
MLYFFIKQGDTSPSVTFSLSPGTVNLAGASVVFNMRLKKGALKISRGTAEIVTPSPPVVRYNWSANDTNTPGLYEAEFEVTYANGKIESFPNNENILIKITEGLA